ncbi:AraC family transcriptional regulator [Providencia stuartii]|uniref:helix-turn-helix domain-containing protein n=1 Tax=Providencia stuartii TaxID=588 RepID=UPI001FF3FA1A|nr:AraC family transcriptional regulator [Providencia stuartii]MCK1143852.1 AraC family transcriptional regulator [Providencia stuartii]
MQQCSEDKLNQAHSHREDYSIGAFIRISRGEFVIPHDLGIDEEQQAGLKLVAIHQGAMSCRSSSGHNVEVNSPSLILSGSQKSYQLCNLFSACQPMKYTMIDISPEWLEQHQLVLPDSCYPSHKAQLRHFAIPASVLAMTQQLFTCPTHPSLHQLYLGAKVTEITALCLHHFLHEPVQTAPKLRQREIDNLHMAKAILMQELESPPSLDVLAKRVGMNTRKLTQGFRQLFGNSIYGWLQEYRLDTAYQLLTVHDANISTIAYQVGYTPAHFSVAFRKRFGLSPNQLKKR